MSAKFAIIFAFLFFTLSFIDAAPAVQSAASSLDEANDGPHVIPPVVAGPPPPDSVSLNTASQPRKVLRRRPLDTSNKAHPSSSNTNIQTMQQLDAPGKGSQKRPAGQANDYYYYYYYY